MHVSQNTTLNSPQIRSFVRRESRITPGQRRAFEQLWPKYGLELQPTPYDYSKIFQRDAKLIVEIGFGMGDSLFKLAQKHPEYNFLGIEVYRPGIGSLMGQLQKENINNVRIFYADAIDVLKNCVADSSLKSVLIYFPDPWPKKRHNKRRLIQLSFINLIYDKLTATGQLHLATDYQEYADHMLQVCANHPGFVLQENSAQYFRSLTKYEKRGTCLGHSIKDFIFVKHVIATSIK